MTTAEQAAHRQSVRRSRRRSGRRFAVPFDLHRRGPIDARRVDRGPVGARNRRRQEAGRATVHRRAPHEGFGGLDRSEPHRQALAPDGRPPADARRQGLRADAANHRRPVVLHRRVAAERQRPAKRRDRATTDFRPWPKSCWPPHRLGRDGAPLSRRLPRHRAPRFRPRRRKAAAEATCRLRGRNQRRLAPASCRPDPRGTTR